MTPWEVLLLLVFGLSVYNIALYLREKRPRSLSDEEIEAVVFQDEPRD